MILFEKKHILLLLLLFCSAKPLADGCLQCVSAVGSALIETLCQKWWDGDHCCRATRTCCEKLCCLRARKQEECNANDSSEEIALPLAPLPRVKFGEPRDFNSLKYALHNKRLSHNRSH